MQSSRNPQLDLLRGIAVILVLQDHFPYIRLVERCGWLGVDLFFVLSGFLISGLLFSEFRRHGRISILRFFVRRGLKIYPAFYFFLGVTALIDPLFHRHKYLAELVFLQNYLPHVWGHTWSLAVEEHFYLFLPVLLYVLVREPRNARRRLDQIPIIATVLLVVCLALRVLTAMRTPTVIQVAFPTHLRIDSLFAGVALGYFHHFHNERFQRWKGGWLILMSAVLLAPSVLLEHANPFILTLGLTMNTAAFGCLLVWMVNRPRIRSYVIEQIGFYSYSIYLWHMLITEFWLTFPVGLVTFLGDAISCIVIGVTMANIVEVPVLRLRDRFIPTVGKPLETEPSYSREEPSAVST